MAVETYRQSIDVFGAFKVSKGTGAARMHCSLYHFRAVECLLLLKQEYVASYRNATDVLAVSAVPWLA